jgi:hypothetical protein
MKTDRELMQQALEALNRSDYLGWQLNIPIIKTIRERLAKPEMQPCAGRNCGSTNPNLHSAECFEDYEKSTGMNKWQGLTDEDDIDWEEGGNLKDLVKAIEAKLKEKNT